LGIPTATGKKYRVRINYWSSLQNHIFTNTEQKYMMLLPFEGGIFAVSWRGQRRPNCRRNARLTATKLLRHTNSSTHQLRSVGEAAISFQHWFTLFPRDGSTDCRTIPNVTFTVCNRHEFHDLATLPTPLLYTSLSVFYNQGGKCLQRGTERFLI
jgi:hypothetical protein